MERSYFLQNPFLYLFAVLLSNALKQRLCCCQTKCHCPHTAALLLFCDTICFTKALEAHSYYFDMICQNFLPLFGNKCQRTTCSKIVHFIDNIKYRNLHPSHFCVNKHDSKLKLSSKINWSN